MLAENGRTACYHRRRIRLSRSAGFSFQVLLAPVRAPAAPLPKLNGVVERANRTHSEEFYPVTVCSLEMQKLNRELRQWEEICNTVHPHQSLGYLTPLQFLLRFSKKGMKVLTIYWRSTPGGLRQVSYVTFGVQEHLSENGGLQHPQDCA